MPRQNTAKPMLLGCEPVPINSCSHGLTAKKWTRHSTKAVCLTSTLALSLVRKLRKYCKVKSSRPSTQQEEPRMANDKQTQICPHCGKAGMIESRFEISTPV